MNRLTTLAALLATATTATSQSASPSLEIAFDDPVSHEESLGAAAFGEGRVFCMGSTRELGALRGVVIAFDQETNEALWRRFLPGFSSGAGFAEVRGRTLFATSVAWRAGGGGPAGTFVTALDAETGVSIWTQTLPNPIDAPPPGWTFTATPEGFEISPDGSTVYVHVSHLVRDPQNTEIRTALLVALDAQTGERLWMASTPEATAFSLAVGPSGTLYALTDADELEGIRHYDVTAFQTDGLALWTTRVTTPGDYHTYWTELAVSPAGEQVVFSGQSYTDIGTDIVMLDAQTGAVQWSAGIEGGAGLATFGPDGSQLHIAGEVYDPPTGWDILVATFDAGSGELHWQQVYDSPYDSNDPEKPVHMVRSGDAIYVASSGAVTAVFPGTNVLAFDAATGQSLWTATYTPPFTAEGHGPPVSLAISDSADRVLVAAETHSGWTGADIGSLAFDRATGELLSANCVDRFAPSHDLAHDFALAQNGEIAFLGSASLDSFALGHRSNLRAIDLGSLEELWQVSHDSDLGGAEVLRTLRLPTGDVLTTEILGPDVRVAAYDASSGAELWSHVVSSEKWSSHPPWELTLDPSGERVVVAYRDKFVAPGTHMVALDTQTGEVAWEVFGDGPTQRVDALTFAPDGQRLYRANSATGFGFILDSVRMSSFDPVDGSEIWSIKVTEEPFNSATEARALAIDPSGQWLFLARANTSGDSETLDILAFDAETAEKRWTKPQVSSPVESLDAWLTTGAQHVYSLSTSLEEDQWTSEVRAFEARTGELAWRASVGTAGTTTVVDQVLDSQARRLWIAGRTHIPPVDPLAPHTSLGGTLLVVALDADTGEELEVIEYDASDLPDGVDQARALALDGDGRPVVFGECEGFGNGRDAVLLRF